MSGGKIEVSKNDLQVLIDERFNHKLRNDKTILHFSGMEQVINDMKTEQALIKKDLAYTKKGIDDIKDAISWLSDKFATKEQHENNSNRIDKIEGVIGKIAWTIIMWVLGIAWASIFVVIMLFWDKF